MKTALGLLLLTSLACHGHAITCWTCPASGSENECYDTGGPEACSTEQDTCATVTGSGTDLRYCSTRDKCKSSSSNAAATCCHVDNCNKPSKTSGASGGPQVSRCILLITALLLGMTFTQL